MKIYGLVIQRFFLDLPFFVAFVVIKCMKQNKSLHKRNCMKQILSPNTLNLLLKTGNGIDRVGHLTALVVLVLIFYK